jgi:hypothetical protein
VTRETERGERVIDHWEPIGELVAILAQEKPEARIRWKQQGFPITHKLIVEGGNGIGIQAGDKLEHQGRRFFVTQQPYDPGELGHWTVFYCQERFDV